MEPASDPASDAHSQASSKKSNSSRRATLSAVVERFTANARLRLKSSTPDLPNNNSRTITQRSSLLARSGPERSHTYSIPSSMFQLSSSTSTNEQRSEGRPRKLFTRLTSTPYYTQNLPPRRSRHLRHLPAPTTPFTPSPSTPDPTPAPLFSSGKPRETSIQITQRQLMAPLGPPIPRSKTMGMLSNEPSSTCSPKTPNFARSTSSSQAKQRERVVSTEKKPRASKTPSSNETRKSSGQRRLFSMSSESKTPTSLNTQRTSGQRRQVRITSESKTPTTIRGARGSLSDRTPTPYSGERTDTRQFGRDSSSGFARSQSNLSNVSNPFQRESEIHTKTFKKAQPLQVSTTPDIIVSPDTPPIELTQADTPTPENVNPRHVSAPLDSLYLF